MAYLTNKPITNLFSQRMGLKIVGKSFKKGISSALRNRLWNCYCNYFFDQNTHRKLAINYNYNTYMSELTSVIIDKIMKETIKEYNISFQVERIVGFYFKCKWHEIFDIIELSYDVSNNLKEKMKCFTTDINICLKEENSIYGFVNGKFLEMTSQEEIDSIVSAIDSGYQTAEMHLSAAVTQLSKRNGDPVENYRQSIDESINAVVGICKRITGKDTKQAELSDALKSIMGTLQTKYGKKLHKSFKQAIGNLYGYASDEEAIRHEGQVSPDLLYADAKFILVICSALVNYLIALDGEYHFKQ